MSSVYTIPLLFLNLGGEMLYILDQRLAAQRIPRDRAFRVMNDITGIMLNQRFLNELFKPQEVYNKPALRQLFEDLAHASIMRLNTESMCKLYDLMTMVFKYQVFMCAQPSDLLLVTLNHLDAMRNFVSLPQLHKQINIAYTMLMSTYGKMSFGELQTLRYGILNFLQDINVRVSVFLREKIQTEPGRFVIPTLGRTISPDSEVPGFIRFFDSNGEVNRMEHFYSGGTFSLAVERGSMEMTGKRATYLGCNIYTPTAMLTTHTVDCSRPDESTAIEPGKSEDKDGGFHVGREELNLLLAQLMGNNSKQQTSNEDMIFVNLFQSDMIEEEEVNERSIPDDVMMIDARYQGCSDALQRVYGEMTLATTSEPHLKCQSEQSQEEENLLDLLDNF